MSRQMAFKDKEFSSESCEHYTPPWLIEFVRDIMGGIDLDPCSSEKANLIIRASKFHTEEQDGLSLDNEWGGRIFINPPGDKRSELVIAFWQRLKDEWYGKMKNCSCSTITEIMFCGHVHSLFKTLPNEKLVNVSVDFWDFRPVSFSLILQFLRSEGKII